MYFGRCSSGSGMQDRMICESAARKFRRRLLRQHALATERVEFILTAPTTLNQPYNVAPISITFLCFLSSATARRF
jgi:hypothetical protein